MNPWIHVTGWTLIHFVWQGALLAVLTAAALRVCRRRSSETRYAIACAGLVAMLLSVGVTAASLWVSRPAFAGENVVAAPVSVGLTVVPSPDEPSTFHTTSGILKVDAFLPSLVWVWLAGVTFCLARFSGGCWRIHRVRSATMAEAVSTWQAAAERLARRLRISVAFRVVESALVEAPTVIGWMRPAILLPAAVLSNLTPGQIEALLAHELAHVRRRDYLVNVLQTLAESLLFFHPGVWWVSSRIRQEREHCCDDVAVAVCGEPASYAEALAEVASWRTRGWALSVGATDGSLLRRVRRLLRVPEQEEPRAWSGVVLSSAGILVAGGLLAMAGPSVAGSEAGPRESQAVPSDWRVRQSDHVEIHYPPDLDLHAERVAQEAERAYERVSLDLKHDVAFRVPILLFPTTRELEQAVQGGKSAPAHAGSFADASRDRILMAADQPADRWAGLLTHEVAHIFAFDILPGDATPPWIMEGLAEYQRGAWDPDDLVALRSAVRDNAIPKITAFRPERASGSPRLVHALGHAAFDYIESRWGKPGMRQFLFSLRQTALKGGDPYQGAFRITRDEFDRGFEEYLRARFAGAASRSPADRFDYGASLRLEGDIIAMSFPVPEGLACLELRVDGSAKKERWAVECGDTAVRELLGALKPGDRVIVIGAPPRKPGTQRIALQRLTRPADGFTWTESVVSRQSIVVSRQSSVDRDQSIETRASSRGA